MTPPPDHSVEAYPEAPLATPGLSVAVIPSGDAVLFPLVVMPFASREDRLVQAIAESAGPDKHLVLVPLQPETPPEQVWNPERFRPIGTLCSVARMLRLPDGTIQALIQGQARVRIVAVLQREPYLKVAVETVPDRVSDPESLEAAGRNLLNLFQKAVGLSPNLPEMLAQEAANVAIPANLVDFVAANLNLSAEDRYAVLAEEDVTERIRIVTRHLVREVDILEIGSRIQTEIQGEMEKGQREYYLRQQLRAIQRELGEGDERANEVAEYRRRIEEAGLPEDARKEAEKEVTRLEGMPPAAAETSSIKTYLDLVLSLPWNTSTVDNLDIRRAGRILDEDHYDLERVKERLLDFLAVRSLKAEGKGPIMCLVGPPGVGKTSLGRSVARALGRRFVRMALGGVRDEAEIRGFRRTYVGSQPGRIIQEIRRAGSNNPVIMLDEIDKIGMDYRGDPTAALLEVLDPAQNDTFTDHYLDVPFDLSKVLFIATANQMDPIPPPLRDRMEVILLPGYTELDKLVIARRYLVPRQIAENGLTRAQVTISDGALRKIIRNFTREAGVRNLERDIGALCRNVARKVAAGDDRLHRITQRQVNEILGPDRFRYEVAEKSDEVGVATGLAWTPVGGEILFVEAVPTRGKGGFQLTGQLGDVMKESAQAALTWVKSKADDYAIPVDWAETHNLHVHVPAGAIPKDGPSAGVTMAMAMLSAMTGRAIDSNTAMTGEITLRGKVMPVGGIKEKVMAAHRAGASRVLLPEQNRRDWDDVPPEIRRDLEVVFLEDAAQAARLVLLKPAPAASSRNRNAGQASAVAAAGEAGSSPAAE